METVKSDDGTVIAFERAGAGPALVMVDAAGCFRGFGPMGALAEELASRFTVFRYDRRGRGDSTDTLPYALEREVEDLRAVIDAAGGQAHVFGFSSGAVLALHAAAQGAPITKLALLEPPVVLDEEPPDEPDLGAETAELVAAGRRGDAIEHFNRSVGVPEEMVAGLRQSPVWPALEALAHTLVYDTVITSAMTREVLSAVAAPTLVVNSEGSDDRLRTWAGEVAAALPDGHHRAMKGEWHGVAATDLAPVITEFLAGRP